MILRQDSSILRRASSAAAVFTVDVAALSAAGGGAGQFDHLEIGSGRAALAKIAAARRFLVNRA